MSQILARDTALRWRDYADPDIYNPTRDGPRARQAQWVIDTLRDRLPPEHVHLARDLQAQQAIAEGRKPADAERVDSAGNRAESALIARLDAQSLLTGYESAVRAALRRAGCLCLRAIVEGDSFATTIRRCGYAQNSKRSVRELVQLTMLAASDYRDVCEAELSRWRTL